MDNWFMIAGIGAVLFPNKNGSTSFKSFLCPESQGLTRLFETWAMARKLGPMTKAELGGVRKLLAVREPVDRFVSLCAHINRPEHAELAKGYIAEHALFGRTPEQVLDVIEGNPDGDPHWRRQSSYYFEGVEVIPYDELLRALGCDLHLNSADVRPVLTSSLEGRVRAFYRDDVDLWSRAAVTAATPPEVTRPAKKKTRRRSKKAPSS